jgi:hypothetical protein
VGLHEWSAGTYPRRPYPGERRSALATVM